MGVAGHFHDCPGERRMVRAGLCRPSPSPGLLLSRRCFPSSQPAHGAHPTGDPTPQQQEAAVSEVKVLTAFAAPPCGGHQSCQPVCPGLHPGGSRVVTTRGQRGAWNPQPAKPCGRCLWTEHPPTPDGWGRKVLGSGRGVEWETPLTVPLVHHGLDDHWKHAPVQVKVQLRREGGDSGQSELDGVGAVSRGVKAVGPSRHRRPFFSAGNGVKGHIVFCV